jgi:transcription elongation factor Elf1
MNIVDKLYQALQKVKIICPRCNHEQYVAKDQKKDTFCSRCGARLSKK